MNWIVDPVQSDLLLGHPSIHHRNRLGLDSIKLVIARWERSVLARSPTIKYLNEIIKSCSAIVIVFSIIMSCFYSLHFLVLASGILLLCLRVDPSESSAKSQFYDLADFPLPVIPMRDPYYASYYASNNNNWHNDGGPAQFKIDTHNNNNRQELESSFLAAERQGSFGGGNKGFGTLTLTLGSSYSTFTVTTSTTCTTSTAAIKVCSPSKGRRRRSNFGIHRLMFDEEEFDESAIFAPRKTEDDHQHLQSVSSIFL